LTEGDGTTFGDASDGDAVFDGTSTVLGLAPSAANPSVCSVDSTNCSFFYVLARDMFFDDLTIDSGVFLSMNGFRVYVSGTLTLNGWIGWPGINAGTPGGAGGLTAQVLGGSSAGGGGSGGATGGCSAACTNGGTVNPGHPECDTAAAAGSSGTTGTPAANGGRCIGGGGGSVSVAAGSCVGAGAVGCTSGTLTRAGTTTVGWLHVPREASELIAARSPTETRMICGVGGG